VNKTLSRFYWSLMRQCTRRVAYLGSFSTRQAKISAQRVYTWEHMLERLDRLSNRMTPKDRKKIEAVIASKREATTTRKRINDKRIKPSGVDHAAFT
jgi:hypothetical protein